jgi:hypothetical protein
LHAPRARQTQILAAQNLSRNGQAHGVGSNVRLHPKGWTIPLSSFLELWAVTEITVCCDGYAQARSHRSTLPVESRTSPPGWTGETPVPRLYGGSLY